MISLRKGFFQIGCPFRLLELSFSFIRTGLFGFIEKGPCV